MANTKILIVENIVPFDRGIETRLRRIGYTVCASVSDGAQAMEMVQEMQVGLVMVYVGREGAMAAVEAAEEMHLRFNVPVICLIDSIEKNVLERINDAKVLGHIFKPFDENQLWLGIENQLHWHRSTDAITGSFERISSILDSVGDGVIASDLEGRVTFMNAAAESLTGWELEEASGKQVPDILDIHVDDSGNLEESKILIEALQKGSVPAGGLPSASEVDYKTSLVARSGGEIPFDYSITPIKDRDKTRSGIVTTFRDISTYKKKEEKSNKVIGELRQQTQLMKTVFDTMYDGIAVLDLTGDILFVNPSIQQIVGKEPPGTSLNQWSETYGFFYPDKESHVPVDQFLDTFIAKGEEVRDLELFVRNKKQTEGIHIKASGIPLFDENQEVVACVCIVRDITGDKIAAVQLEQAMQDLQNQVQLMDTIFNSMGDGVIAADKSGAFTIFNPSAESILGIGPINSTPEKWSNDYGFFFPDRDTPFPADELPLARALRGEASDEVEMFVRNPKVPEGVFISVSGRPLRYGEGTEKGGMIVFRDVTHRVVAEEALTQAFAQGRLEIVETIVHNIGNAINSVTVGINVLQEDLVGNEFMDRFLEFADVVKAHQEDWVDYIRYDPQGQLVRPLIIALAANLSDQNREVVETLERVSERVRHINDIIRTQKSFNHPTMMWKEINLEKAILNALKLQQDSIDKRGIQVDVNCENAPDKIRIQESQFNQMLVNLIKNSIEAIDDLARSGGFNETPRIAVRAYISEDFLCLDVTDNGVGIEQKNFKLIFTAGFTTKESGTGLGLHSSANFVIGSGGKVYPLSEGIGKGTTMRIMLRCSSVIP